MCVVSTYTTVGPIIAGSASLGISPAHFPLQIWALNAEAKKRKEKQEKCRRNIFQQCNSVRFLLMYTQIHSVSSLNADDFTKTVFIIRKDRVLVYREHCVCL